MTVDEMIERLTELSEDGDGEKELRLAFQPSWPLRFTVGGIVGTEDMDPECKNCEEYRSEHWYEDGTMYCDDPTQDGGSPDFKASEKDGEFVWITEGGSPSQYDESPYAPRSVFDAARR